MTEIPNYILDVLGIAVSITPVYTAIIVKIGDDIDAEIKAKCTVKINSAHKNYERHFELSKPVYRFDSDEMKKTEEHLSYEVKRKAQNYIGKLAILESFIDETKIGSMVIIE